MMLYDSKVAPNPRRVRIFLHEKGIVVQTTQVDLAKGDHWRQEFTQINPLQRIPALALDNGAILTESVAICRYFEEIAPEPALFGSGALGRATVEMWQRRLELSFLLPIAMAFRHSHPAMAEMEKPQIPLVAETNRPRALAFLATLDAQLAANRFVAGEAYSIADITGLVAMDFLPRARIDLPAGLSNVTRWYKEIAARPSAAA